MEEENGMTGARRRPRPSKNRVRKYRFHSLELGGRIILLACLTNFIIVLIMSYTLYYIQHRSAAQSLTMERGNLCEEANSVAENACAYLRGAADYFSISEDMEYIIRSEHNDPEASRMASRIFSFFQPNNYILSVVLYDTGGTPLQYMSIDASHTPLPQGDNPVFQSLISRQNTYVWEYVDRGSGVLFRQDNSPKLCLWRVVKNSNNTTILGAIAVSMDVRKLLNYEVAYTSSYRRSFLIFDRQNGSVISNRTGLNLSDAEIAQIHGALPTEGDGYFECDLDSGASQVFYRSISDTNLVTLYITSSMIPGSGPMLFITVCVAFFTFVILMIPLFLYITRNLTRPLEQLTHEIRQFSRGDYSANIPNASNDTIGRVQKAFNRMVVENKRLVEQTYVAELKSTEAELILLQAQINPHFIYNLINTIQWSALRHGDKDVADLAYSMGQVLRISLNRGSAIIPVHKECELISYYLTLQKYRYGSKLDYVIECSDDARDIMIPKLIVQPLVENSIVHGAADLITVLHIRTHICTKNGALLIEIEDDGSGIPPCILEQLPDRFNGDAASAGNGLAIRNIYERLALIYGRDAFDFVVSSEENCGTFITIRLPLRPPERPERKERN